MRASNGSAASGRLLYELTNRLALKESTSCGGDGWGSATECGCGCNDRSRHTSARASKESVTVTAAGFCLPTQRITTENNVQLTMLIPNLLLNLAFIFMLK